MTDLAAELERTRQELHETAEQLRMAQAQLVQAGRLSALGQLVAGIAHEMNNPLSSVIGYAQLLHQQVVRRPELAEQAKDLLPDIGSILAEASRAARIVRNLLLFARRQTSAHAVQDLEFLCDQVVELRAHDLRLNGVEITTSFGPELPAIFADGSQIQQLLLNLVLNAEQALLHSPVRRIDVIVSAEPDCGAVLMEVRDSGEGISRDSLGRVFEPFYTTRPTGEGSGLGLSIAAAIARSHGGQIWAASEAFVRTSFFVRLPAADDRIPTFADRAALVFLDDAHTRESVAAALAGWGLAVDPNPALDAARLAAGAPPAVVIADATAVRRDLDLWDRAWAKWGGDCALIAVGDRLRQGLGESTDGAAQADAAAAALRRHAHTVVGPSPDLCELHRALTGALAAPNAVRPDPH
jgi:nitrogen-specific signal transduction histidine kinase